MNIKQIIPRSTERYPWTHRVEFDENLGDNWPVYEWTENEGIPGVWAGGNFYTVGKYATLIALKWSRS